MPELLDAFDTHVLGRYLEEAQARFKATAQFHDAMSVSDIFGKTKDRQVYEALSSALARLKGEDRLAFLYGLREALVTAQEVVQARGTRMSGLQEVTHDLVQESQRVHSPAANIASNFALSAPYDQIESLRAASSGYRDIYRVMVDQVRQALPK